MIIIKQIFNGNRGSHDTMKMQGNKEYDKSLDKVCGTYEQLQEKLSPELFKIYKEYVEAVENCHCEKVDFYFIEGFKLGVLIGIECAN